MTNTTFKEFALGPKIQKALEENNFDTPFPIQAAAIPLILEGKDVVGQAHTGTGKTAAYSLPVLAKIQPEFRAVQALILVPTRELAVQVTAEISRFARHTQVKTTAIYGGQGYGIQIDSLRRGSQIVVATPGRLIDHLKRGTIKLGTVKYLVLDESDRMLDMGFIEDIEFILSKIDKRDRQTLLFSATMPAEILRLAKKYMKADTKEIRLNKEEVTIDSIDQSYLIVSEDQKFNQLAAIIKSNPEKQIIVFAATKRRADKLAANIKGSGFKANAIHGDLSQNQRDNVMQRFRKGSDQILVATDIAARGIDVPTVEQIVNYDVPNETETYFHRIGRTARAGAKGKAVSLVTPDRFSEFERILRQTKLPIQRLNESMGIAIPVMHGQRPNRRPGFGNRNKSQSWRRGRRESGRR